MDINVKRAMFAVTGTYNDMALRPYQAHFSDRGLVNQFMEYTDGGERINSETLAPVAGQFLTPTTEAIGFVQPDNGWGVKRLRFLIHLVIDQPTAFGATDSIHKILQGYTDYVGVSHSGHIDPNMRLYFNNVISFKQGMVQTPHGTKITSRPISNDQILTGTPLQQPGQTHQPTRLMRPHDLLDDMSKINALDMQVASTPSHHMASPFETGDPNVLDFTSPFVESTVVKSNRSNTRAPRFVDSIFSAWREASLENEEDSWGIQEPSTFEDIYSRTRSKVRHDETFPGDPLMNRIYMETTFKDGGSITYRELTGMCPEIDHPSITTVALERDVVRQPTPSTQAGIFPDVTQRGDSEEWGGRNNETVWATTLTNSVPSLMMDTFLTYVSFTATNQTIDGQPIVTPLGVNTLIGDQMPDLDRYFQIFLSRLETEIIRSLSLNNHIDYSITMETDVLGDTKIHLTIAGGYPVLFSVPSFGDALFSPVLAPNALHVSQVGQGFKNFIEDIGSVMHQNQLHNESHGGSGFIV